MSRYKKITKIFEDLQLPIKNTESISFIELDYDTSKIIYLKALLKYLQIYKQDQIYVYIKEITSEIRKITNKYKKDIAELIMARSMYYEWFPIENLIKSWNLLIPHLYKITCPLTYTFIHSPITYYSDHRTHKGWDISLFQLKSKLNMTNYRSYMETLVPLLQNQVYKSEIHTINKVYFDKLDI